MKKKIKPAKLCFGHVGGKLGTLLFEQFVASGWLAKADGKHFFITSKGEAAFTKMGIDLSLIKDEAPSKSPAADVRKTPTPPYLLSIYSVLSISPILHLPVFF